MWIALTCCLRYGAVPFDKIKNLDVQVQVREGLREDMLFLNLNARGEFEFMSGADAVYCS